MDIGVKGPATLAILYRHADSYESQRGTLAAMPSDLSAAFAALDDCDEAITKLHKTCCLPERSPSMLALEHIFRRSRGRLDEFDRGDADELLSELEDAGGRIGALQVSCCAPNRMPLYERLLTGLNTIQLTVNKALDRGH